MNEYNSYKLSRVSFEILGDAKKSIKLGEVLYTLKAVVMLSKLSCQDRYYNNLMQYVTNVKNIYSSKTMKNVHEIMQYTLCGKKIVPTNLKIVFNYSTLTIREIEKSSQVDINVLAFQLFYGSFWKNISSNYLINLKQFDINSSENFEVKRIKYYLPVSMLSIIYPEIDLQKFRVQEFVNDFSSWLKYNMLAEIKEYYIDKDKNLVITIELNYLSQSHLT